MTPAPALTRAKADAPPSPAALLRAARRVVLKVGSALLVDPATGAPNRAWLSAFALDVARLRAGGAQVVIVSSGAVALGRRRLNLTGAPGLPAKQAAAAAGQSLLMRAWEEALEPHSLVVAQVLLTRDDTERRRRWLNARATLEALLRLGVVPVVNENDTVATEEIRYGDNDRLAARTAQLSRAEALVLLSDVDGLYTADPRRNPTASHIPYVDALTPEIQALGGGPNAEASVGTGGMRTKLQAVAIARQAGCATLIVQGQSERPLTALDAGAKATLFAASETPDGAYKAWIAGSLAPQGALRLDAGAAAAVRSGASLLPSGVTAVEGRFDKGDCVAIEDEAGHRLALGLVNYAADEVARLKGRRSEEIEAVLGYRGRSVVIHRDDLVRVDR
jgi:glutamate 5-kinase